nr:DUF4160 domain-containing protein [Thermoanaerobacterium sp. PSU-2]
MFNINTLKMIEGDLPKRTREMIIEWQVNIKTSY